MSRRYAGTCDECGGSFTTTKLHGQFCSTLCRKTFNNRRMVRGAELYDLFMTLRYDRSLATAMKVWKLLCRMAHGFRQEDLERRAGRHSWRHPKEVIERRPYLMADVIMNGLRR